MAKNSKPKKLASNPVLENKLYDVIQKLLEQKSEDKQFYLKKTDEEANSDPLANIFLAKDLRPSEVLIFAQQKDVSLLRVKKILLEKTIDKVLELVREEEQEEMGSLGITLDDSDFDGVNEDELMEVKPTNAFNKSVVSLWNISPAATKENTPDEPNDEPKDEKKEVDEKKEEEETDKANKKRSKDSTKPAKRQKASKDRTPPASNLATLGGMDDIIQQLTELVSLPMLHPEIYLTTGISPPRGILLHGPPGCGKTTLANALAGELQVPFLNVSAPSIVSGMSGESEKKVRELFEEAKTLAPCLVFLDEIDAITPKRDGAQREMERRIVAQLLTAMDELSLDKTGGKPVIIIGATNRPDSLDPALRRAGRFDREICLNVPDENSRARILQTMVQNMKISGDLDFADLAKRTPGYVGADLKALTSAAGIAGIKRIFNTLSEDLDRMDIDPAQLSELLINDTSDIQRIEQNNMEAETIAIDEVEQKIPDDIQKMAPEEKEAYEKLSTIQKFLKKHPLPLTPAQLEPLCITFEDFLTALPSIQPTAKREGFATVPDVTWQNIGALSKIRVEMHMAIVQPVKHPKLYSQVGITAPSGVLLWGPPGCGKTLLAKAVANESKANFISVKGPELLNKYVGESEKAVRQVFSRARASMPCIIFFDELDALVPRRDSSLSESSSRVVNTLLTELDGLNDRQGVFVIGATNRPDMIDSAMLRPGRLDKSLFVELPTADERFEILKTVVRTNGTPVDESVDLRVVAHDEKCRNFSGADLSSLVREAGVVALKKRFFVNIHTGDESTGIPDGDIEDVEHMTVTGDDFFQALKSIKPSVSDRERAKYEKLSKRMGWADKEEETEGSSEAVI
ncbi:hypothetical protein BABINDRAFT_8526 [Babjeviella inositovora NRRL Y-12698]|uniref:AAA+ ATPase domain-containing protein n=1 Tax=Babjeviella inositovora NRRL Y-12698 TaxID=984486 RepID=A0A1E3QPK7_9ASCO|nr:uncharacterized protein BABINDRAFT_8526 [Babjeviella inositovora NRRL Y-12698]ODQ79625.1 hypothetical protein BABINDRAFT_8526 [Babjeviella inositovora NRRL Y-12698]